MKEDPNCPVENYSLSQCSLEQVFIKLVKEANEREFGTASSGEEERERQQNDDGVKNQNEDEDNETVDV
jgi:hypothetical protein